MNENVVCLQRRCFFLNKKVFIFRCFSLTPNRNLNLAFNDVSDIRKQINFFSIWKCQYCDWRSNTHKISPISTQIAKAKNPNSQYILLLCLVWHMPDEYFFLTTYRWNTTYMLRIESNDFFLCLMSNYREGIHIWNYRYI